RALKVCCGIKVLKVIVETCYLTEEEKVAVCKCVTEGGADYIKTSTGFGTAGATLADVELFKRHIGEDVKIKAAGGIRTIEDLMAFLHAGCDRIGTSAAVSLLKDKL
ncbi:MAG: deoxyribose-phosphate aldolase, partial [Lachnospiraceae bacterium]|nr:deoxyribose-phosphate aldolase [Lachnospiraceae bacterium]